MKYLTLGFKRIKRITPSYYDRALVVPKEDYDYIHEKNKFGLQKPLFTQKIFYRKKYRNIVQTWRKGRKYLIGIKKRSQKFMPNNYNYSKIGPKYKNINYFVKKRISTLRNRYTKKIFLVFKWHLSHRNIKSNLIFNLKPILNNKQKTIIDHITY